MSRQGSIGARSPKQLFVTQLTDHFTVDREGLGAVAYGDDGKRYKWVKFTAGSPGAATVVGDIVTYISMSLLTVTGDVSAGNGVVAGIAMSTPADGEYFWIQTKGFAAYNTALASGSNGDAFTGTGNTTDNSAKVAAAATDALSGIILDTTAKTVYLDCPD